MSRVTSPTMRVTAAEFERMRIAGIFGSQRVGVPDLWIANLKAGGIEVYREPLNPTGNVDDCRYASVMHYHRGETIASLVRPEATFRVDDLLP